MKSGFTAGLNPAMTCTLNPVKCKGISTAWKISSSDCLNNSEKSYLLTTAGAL